MHNDACFLSVTVLQYKKKNTVGSTWDFQTIPNKAEHKNIRLMSLLLLRENVVQYSITE
jgi:hypothetical protein